MTTDISQLIEIVFTFDTTGSMYPVLSQVRQKAAQSVQRLFKQIPNLRVGIIAHGDYCDEGRTYVTKHQQLTTDVDNIVKFINTVGATGGGDFPECYELVLQEIADQMDWTEGSKRAVAMIGDAPPHKPTEYRKIDWRKELSRLVDMGITVHGVQAMNDRESEAFYSELARKSNGAHLRLAQFGEATEMLLAVAYQQQSPEALQAYEEEIVTAKRMTRSMSGIFDALSKRDAKGRYRKVDVRAVEATRFQQIEVDYDQPIKTLVNSCGLIFKTGRGFYEFTKKETIQSYKEIVIMDKETGDMYQGEAAREVLGLPMDSNTDIKPTYDKAKYTVFVQSTSNNRKLIGGTLFLYEAEIV